MPTDISDNKSNTDLIFTFDNGFTPVLFDDETTHGRQDRMKKVDFIVTSSQQTWLIEAKDPDNRQIPPQHRKDSDSHGRCERKRSERRAGDSVQEVSEALMANISGDRLSQLDRFPSVRVPSVYGWRKQYYWQ